jgi:hypothetical protein
MKLMTSLVAALLVACASHPAKDTNEAAPVRSVDAATVAQMQKTGYTIKTKDGQKIYCSNEKQTGSHLQSTTACLTEEQWMRVHQTAQDTLKQMNEQGQRTPPNPGH